MLSAEGEVGTRGLLYAIGWVHECETLGILYAIGWGCESDQQDNTVPFMRWAADANCVNKDPSMRSAGGVHWVNKAPSMRWVVDVSCMSKAPSMRSVGEVHWVSDASSMRSV